MKTVIKQSILSSKVGVLKKITNSAHFGGVQYSSDHLSRRNGIFGVGSSVIHHHFKKKELGKSSCSFHTCNSQNREEIKKQLLEPQTTHTTATLLTKIESLHETLSPLQIQMYLNSKSFIEKEFGGCVEHLVSITKELMNPEKTPLIRSQRLGVALSIAHKINKELLEEMLLTCKSVLIADLIASRVNEILDRDEVLSLFEGVKFKRMNDHVRIAVERCIRKKMKHLIVDVVKRLIGAHCHPRECVVMISHLPSSTDDTVLLELLKQLNNASIEIGSMIKKHPNVVSKYLRAELDKVIEAASPKTKVKRAAFILSTHKNLFKLLCSQRSELAFDIVCDYLIDPSLNVGMPPTEAASFLKEKCFLKLEKYQEYLLKCIPVCPNIVQSCGDLFRKLTINQYAKITFCIIESLKYSTSSDSNAFITQFFAHFSSNGRSIMKQIRFFEKLYSLGLSKEKLTNWIYANLENTSSPGEYLANYPSDVAGEVAFKMYTVRKERIFDSINQESQYWKYFYNLEDETLFNQFKKACSNPSSEVRSAVIEDLLFCSLFTGKKIMETLEFIKSRVKNDEDLIQTIFERILYSEPLRARLSNLFSNKQYLDCFQRISKNALKKTQSVLWNVSEIYLMALGRQINNEAAATAIIKASLSNPTSRENFYFNGKMNPQVHISICGVLNDCLKSSVINDGSLSMFVNIIKSIHRPEKHEHVRKLICTFFDEWIKEWLKKTTTLLDIKILFSVYLRMNKSSVGSVEKVKKLLSLDSRFLSLEEVQSILLNKRSQIEKDYLHQYLKDHVLSSEELLALTPAISGTVYQLGCEEAIVFHPYLLNSLRLNEYASSETIQRLSSTYKDTIIKSLRTNFTINGSYISNTEIIKAIVKSFGPLLLEKEEMDGFVNYLEENILKEDKYENDDDYEEELTNLDDIETRSLALLIRIYSQDPTRHLDYVLENITPENAPYFYSALCRISTFTPSLEFIEKFCAILKTKFEQNFEKKDQPKNFSISIQKMFISFFKNHVDYLSGNPILDIVSDFLLQLWQTKIHKDVQVIVLQTAKKLASLCETDYMFKKLEKIFKDSISHSYEAIVLEQVQNVFFKNSKVAREYFNLNLEGLHHPDIVIRSKIWSVISATVSNFDARALSSTFNPIDQFSADIVSSALDFNPTQGHYISDAALSSMLSELFINPEETSAILIEKIITPLMTETKYKELDEITFNASHLWDKPVSDRLEKLARKVSMIIANDFEKTHYNTFQSIQNGLIKPWIKLAKENVENLVPYACLVASNTEWNNAQSIVENCISRVASLSNDMQEPLKSIFLIQLSSNVDAILLYKFRFTDQITQAITQVIEGKYTVEEQIIASGILASLEKNEKTRQLLRKARGKNNILINILTK